MSTTSTSMSLWQVANTSISFRKNEEVEKIRQAVALLKRYERRIKQLKKEEKTCTKSLSKCQKRNDAQGFMLYANRLSQVFEEKKVLLDLLSKRDGGASDFIFSSAMLVESFKYASQTEDEWVHFIVGVEWDNSLIGTRIVTFPYSRQSVVGVSGEHSATHKIMIDTFESDHRLIAIVHSHPGWGIDANHHSSIDRKTQKLWEVGTEVIGGIWSRDGYLRFFSYELGFQVNVVGNHLHRIEGEKNVWKIQDLLEM